MDPARVWRIEAAAAEGRQHAAAAALSGLGLRSGDRAAFVNPTSPALLVAVLGALRAGIVPVVLNPALTATELDPLLADCEPGLVVRDGAALEELVGEDAATTAGRAGPSGPAGAGAVELAPVPLARPMHYTSGTTGTPKGVWSGVLDEAGATALHDDEGAVWGFGPDDVVLLASPLHHSAPVRFAAGVLLRGGAVVLVERFDPDVVAAAIEAHRPTVAFLVPSHLHRLFAATAEGLAPDLASFRLLAHAGERCPAALKQRALDAFPAGSVWEFYGSTEGQFTVCGPDEWTARPGTVGRARPGRTLRLDGDGQIWCRVPPWARFEYWRDPVKTAEAWDGDAFTVGDVGRLDGDGYLFLDGRRDDLIITGGVNVYPAEVEAVLAAVPGVEAVAVFGVRDDRWGQRVCAAVVGGATDAAIEEAARSRLAPYKRPKQLVRVDALPLTSTGKVRRSRLGAALGVEAP